MGRKLSIALLALAVLVGAGLWGWSFFRTEIDMAREVARQLPKDVNIDVSAKGVTLSQGEAGELLWDLTADSAAYKSGKGTVVLTNPVITYHAADGGTVRIEAPQGEVDQTNNTMVLTPKVKAVYGQVVVTGDRLDYQGKTRRILISGDVVVQKEDMVMTGPKLEIDLTNRDIIASEGVRVVIARKSPAAKTAPESKK